MGFGIKELLIVLIIVALVFGTRKLKTVGSDIGSAVKGFKNAMNEKQSEETVVADSLEDIQNKE